MPVHSAADTALLTIAIPTYNRSRYLRQCLETLMPQVVDAGTDVLVLVLDNQTTDDTPLVLEEFARLYPDHLEVRRNAQNIGGDANIAECYISCETEYAWIFGDDDILMPKTLSIILNLIKSDRYGLIHIKTFPYHGINSKIEMQKINIEKKYRIIDKENINKLLYDVADMFTFISANIVNKSLVSSKIDASKYIWTHLNQLQWTFSAAFSAEKNIIVDDTLIAINNDGDAGGYAFCKVFGTNQNLIFESLGKSGISFSKFNVINRKMLMTMFPRRIYIARNGKDGFYFDINEDFYNELKPIYKSYWEFWICVAPMCKLPKQLLYIHYCLVRVLNRLIHLTR